MVQKYDSRRIRVEIRQVLMDVWDPIGIKHVGLPAADEDDSYLGEVLELLTNGTSDEDIAKHLWKIVTDDMGLESAKLEDMKPTVRALRLIPLPSDSPLR